MEQKRVFGKNEVITVDQAYNNFLAGKVMDRMAWHDIAAVAEGKGDEEVKKLYPGWKDDDFKNLSDRLTQAIKEGKLTLG